MIRELLAGYPSLKEVHDPAGYVAALITILKLYEPVDARAGVKLCAESCPFGPSRYELRQACEKVTRQRMLSRIRSDQVKQQFTDRREHESGETLEERRATVARVLGEMRAHGFTFTKDKPHNETPESVRRKLGLTKEQWDALPDAPPRKTQSSGSAPEV